MIQHNDQAMLGSVRSLLTIILALATSTASATGSESMPGPERQRELVRLVRQDCGSCHGMQLTGGLGLPLTPEALREKPFESLVATVVYGRPGTAMPPWQTILSEPEAEWIVRKLMSGFPEERR